jgi:hypothetical protein
VLAAGDRKEVPSWVWQRTVLARGWRKHERHERHRQRDPRARTLSSRKPTMLYTVAVVLLILWLLGLVTSFTAGGLLHILLVVAVIMIVFQLITGRRAL